MDIRSPINARSNERGATMVEYSLMAALIALTAIGSVTFVGEEGAKTFREVGRSFPAIGLGPGDDSGDQNQFP